MIPLVDWLGFQASIRPDHNAIITPRATLTYAQLFRASNAAAARLRQTGVSAGETVGILALNPALQIVLSIAVNQLGAVLCLLPFDHERRAAAFHIMPFDKILCDEEVDSSPPANSIRVNLEWLQESIADRDLPRAVPVGPNATCMIAISSGTASDINAIAFSASQLERRLTWRGFEEQSTCPGEKTLIVITLSSMLGFLTAFATLQVGGTVYLGWVEAAALNLIERARIERVVGSTPLISEMTSAFEAHPVDCTSLRTVYAGGEPMPEKIARRIVASMCPYLVTAFGTNETGQIAVAPVQRLDFQPEKAGFILPWTEVEAVDESDNPLPFGHEGVLRVRSPGAAFSYLNNPQATAARFRDGWFYTGDLGWTTANGMLVVTGRISEFIRLSTGRFHPRTINIAAAAFPALVEAFAFGVPGTNGDDEIWLSIVAEEGFELPKFRQFLAEKLHDHAPRHFLRLKTLPRNESGKISRRKLTELAALQNGR